MVPNTEVFTATNSFNKYFVASFGNNFRQKTSLVLTMKYQWDTLHFAQRPNAAQ